jgi:hypothetical protein
VASPPLYPRNPPQRIGRTTIITYPSLLTPLTPAAAHSAPFPPMNAAGRIPRHPRSAPPRPPIGCGQRLPGGWPPPLAPLWPASPTECSFLFVSAPLCLLRAVAFVPLWDQPLEWAPTCTADPPSPSSVPQLPICQPKLSLSPLKSTGSDPLCHPPSISPLPHPPASRPPLYDPRTPPDGRFLISPALWGPEALGPAAGCPLL